MVRIFCAHSHGRETAREMNAAKGSTCLEYLALLVSAVIMPGQHPMTQPSCTIPCLSNIHQFNVDMLGKMLQAPGYSEDTLDP